MSLDFEMADVENATEPAELASSEKPAVQEVPADAAETEDAGADKDAEAAEEGKDPNCYLNREAYSSERFKLEIRNLPKSFGFGVRRLYFHHPGPSRVDSSFVGFCSN